MAMCRECERTLKTFEVPRGTCQSCAAKSVQALVKSRHIPQAGIFDLDGGGPSLDDLLTPAIREEEKVREFEMGWATFVRENGDATVLSLMQVWVANNPMLVIRSADELSLFLFKEIPTVGYKEISSTAGTQYVLLSNGPLVRTDRRDLGPTMADVTTLVRRDLLKIKDRSMWSPGVFRKEQVFVFSLTSTVAINSLPLLEHLESWPD